LHGGVEAQQAGGGVQVEPLEPPAHRQVLVQLRQLQEGECAYHTIIYIYIYYILLYKYYMYVI
jgi:hypothetical protein